MHTEPKPQGRPTFCVVRSSVQVGHVCVCSCVCMHPCARMCLSVCGGARVRVHIHGCGAHTCIGAHVCVAGPGFGGKGRMT